MEVVADLHLHSKYSRAVSSQMMIPEIAKWATKKGIGLVGSADWTHPLWLAELKQKLVEIGEGVFACRQDLAGPKFLLTTEIASIFSQGGKIRRIHTMVFAPNFSVVEKINEKLRGRGANLLADGRPMTGLPVKDLAEIVFSVSPECLVIPSHLWTPWFGTYGDKGGFDSLEEGYGNLSGNILAIETGLSSDPAMNFRVAELDNRSILSFSDAHSPSMLGREATVFKVEDVSYPNIHQAIKTQQIAYTIEFYPEEGKYHFTGHRNCGVRQSPEETKKLGETCPVCGKPLTVGVMLRVEELATRTKEEAAGTSQRPKFFKMVPLLEILAEVFQSGSLSKTVLEKYDFLVKHFGSELTILLKSNLEEITKVAGEKLGEGIKRVREGRIVVDPGYDGVFGTVKIWGAEEGKDGEEAREKEGEKSR